MSHINPLNRKSLNAIGSWEEDWDGTSFYQTEAGDTIIFAPRTGQFFLDELTEEINEDIAREIIWKSKAGRRVR